MSYFYSAIKLDDKFEDYLKEGKQLKEISGLSHINIFVGENNSGKSRFLRDLSKINPFEFHKSGLNMAKLDETIKYLNAEMASILALHTKNFSDFSIVSTNSNLKLEKLNIAAYYTGYFKNSEIDVNNSINLLIELFKKLQGYPYQVSGYYVNTVNQLQTQIHSFLKTNENLINSLDEYLFEEIKFNKFYIPILRSLNNLETYKHENYKNTEIYTDRIRQIYRFDKPKDEVDIFTGQNVYIRIRDMLLGEKSERDRVRNYENFLKQKLFNNLDVSLIPKVNSDVLHVKIGSDEKAIYDLGDGIQSLIILTFLLFESPNSLFFIEEPETHLHPGMQRKLIDVLKEFKNHQYFITTHSNHLLDLTLDYNNISIYTFVKWKEKTEITQVKSGDENILNILGVQNSSVFLSNCTIWIEGITDRLYIRKFLELYQHDLLKKKKISLSLQEDIDYSFVEYSGNNIAHWSFLDSLSNKKTINVDRLCSKLLLIADQDGEKKIGRKQALKSKLGKRFILLECREIENILSLETILKVIKYYEKDATLSLPKFRNPYPHMDKPLGTFIEKTLLKEKYKRLSGYKDKSGTLKDKPRFCEIALEHMKYSEMTPLAKKLAKDIYNFILDNKK